MKKNVYGSLNLNCGNCGFKSCEDFFKFAKGEEKILNRCPFNKKIKFNEDKEFAKNIKSKEITDYRWKDSLNREFDFYLEHFPEDPGPREIILPHNPAIVKKLKIKKGDFIFGRPLGISCGCPITHCGIVKNIEEMTGILTWCVTGPLSSKRKDFKDIGYYRAEAYEGIVKEKRCELKIEIRYFFQPRYCMLQWRHSGSINYLNYTKEGIQVRIEGLWIG